MTSFSTYLIILSVLAAPPENKKQDALQSIESTRGGRHWVDAKTAPPKSPEESKKCLQLEPGLKIELFASEPLVMDPVAIAFDQRGRMFVVEYSDYPTGAEDGKTPLSRVVMLEDTDGDHRADRRHVFADGLTFCHSLMPFKEGILVGAQTEIIFLKDTDGDNKADVREVLFKGFKPAHPQMQIGNPRWGFDNWVYLNYGPGEITSAATPDKKLTMPRNEFRFHPHTMQHGPVSGLGQFGNTIDNWGNRFFCTNRNPIMTPMLSWSESRRNPFAVIPKIHYDVGPSGGNTLVYPLVEMKSNYLSHAGTHTSACGTTAYRGDLLGPKFENSVFVCEPIGHLVTRSIVKPSGLALDAQRARPKADFLASSDTWFRPASLATGPDGSLYLADMYRLWVEHPKFLPEEIAKQLDWRAGDDRGRVWRIVPDNAKPRSFEPPESTSDLVALLSDSNGWRRHLAQRLLVERQAKVAAPQIAKVLTKSDSALGRFHALWTLDGLGELKVENITKALNDSDEHVRRAAVRLATARLTEIPSLVDSLVKLSNDKNVGVRFQLALALGETDKVIGTEVLTRLARRDGADHWFAAGILTSAKDRSGAIIAGLVKDTEFVASGDSGRVRLIRELATVVGARGDQTELAELLNTIGAAKRSGAWWQTAALSGLATGLPRHRGSLGRTSLPKLLATPSKDLAKSVEPVRALLDRTQDVALNHEQSLGDRIAAIELLGYQPFDRASAAYDQLLAASQPVDVQLASIDAMRKNAGDRAGEILLEHWQALGPNVRGPALDLLVRRTETTRQMLAAMSAGKINPAVIGIDQRVRLLRHGDKSIRELSTKLFGGAISANRREVAEKYSPALTMKATVEAGSQVFKRTCMKCHKMDGQGFEVGPDISDVRNRSREALLYDILDPNRKLEPRFTDYVVMTDDGRIFNGLMVAETAETVILRQAEGKQQIIPRTQIEKLRASGKSLMPEGVEKEITVQQMADLIEYLKSRGTPSDES